MSEYVPMSAKERDELAALPARVRWNRLATVVAECRADIASARADLDYAQAWLVEEMQAQGALDAMTDDWQIHLKNASTYVYDDEGLAELQGYLEADEYDQAVKRIETLKWSKAALNKLHKRGGVIAQIIDGGVQEASRRTDVELYKRA